MTSCIIRGIPVSFPFEPYPIQKEYMGKVIDCLQNESNGILESPTGTGKTLSLLCSSLAWLSMKKAQMKLHMQSAELNEANEFVTSLQEDLNKKVGGSSNVGQPFFQSPTIIYASRTHSQITQAMHELKRTSYSHMKATVLGSREQMCIHPDIIPEPNNVTKMHMCRTKILSKSCHFYNRIDRKKDDPIIRNLTVVDIEDLVTLGKTHKFCPYYMAKEMKQHSDIIFMPYNYLLDSKVRKGLGIELANSIIILDEAHNVDKMCEESASFQITSTDIALCIEEVTEVMKAMSNENAAFIDEDMPKDLDADELYALKEILLSLEKTVDNIPIQRNSELTTFEGHYMFDILKKAGIRDDNYNQVISVLDKVIQLLSTARGGPFQRKGNYLQLLCDLLMIAFTSTTPEFREKIQKCYKVHVCEEDTKKKIGDTWLSKAKKKAGRVLNYWCFSPGFGMNMLLKQGVKCVILTSGTLAPLQPLISELEMKVDVRLENPHVVSKNQVCVKIICNGPDGEPLDCSFRNRDNPRFVSSLGRSIVNLSRMIPGGLLIFFPSYPILIKCQNQWQDEGTWSNINSIKTIFVESKNKETFANTMTEYYKTVQEPNSSGAIFMAVCRGKVSEGLDFADNNGRGVIVIGIPYPPMKDPRVILKKQYLDGCKSRDKQYLGGDDWYTLEATRTVNQAIGRVIRHKNDYGVILLLDSRFTNPRIISQMSRWLRDRIEKVYKFGPNMRDIRLFFKAAIEMLPQPTQRVKIAEESPTVSVPAAFEIPKVYTQTLFNFSASQSAPLKDNSNLNLVSIHKRTSVDLQQATMKRKKITIIPQNRIENASIEQPPTTSTKEYIIMVQKALEPTDFHIFLNAIKTYHKSGNFDQFTQTLDTIFSCKSNLRYVIQGLSSYVKDSHKTLFEEYWSKIRNTSISSIEFSPHEEDLMKEITFPEDSKVKLSEEIEAVAYEIILNVNRNKYSEEELFLILKNLEVAASM